jgi:hypothetical protein
MFIITNYNVWFVVRNGSVHLHLLIPQYVYVIIIIIIFIILGISFMQGIYTHIPEKNHVPREHCVAAILM